MGRIQVFRIILGFKMRYASCTFFKNGLEQIPRVWCWWLFEILKNLPKSPVQHPPKSLKKLVPLSKVSMATGIRCKPSTTRCYLITWQHPCLLEWKKLNLNMLQENYLLKDWVIWGVCSALRSIGGWPQKKSVLFSPISRRDPIKLPWLEQKSYFKSEKE